MKRNEAGARAVRDAHGHSGGRGRPARSHYGEMPLAAWGGAEAGARKRAGRRRSRAIGATRRFAFGATAKARRARSLKGGDGLARKAVRQRTGAIAPPRRQREAGWFRPPRHAHPSRVPLQSCAAPLALRRRADGPRGFPRDAWPRAAGASFCTCPRRWWSAARRCARRVHDPRKVMRRATIQRCRALRRSISPRLRGAAAKPDDAPAARPRQSRAYGAKPAIKRSS